MYYRVGVPKLCRIQWSATEHKNTKNMDVALGGLLGYLENNYFFYINGAY